MLDVFNTDAFNMVSLTTALNKLPHVPMRIGQMNLFTPKGITTRTPVIEERHGRLSLLQTKAPGTHDQVWRSNDRTAKAFNVPYIPLDAEVKASDVAGVRAFGSETVLETVAGKVNDVLQEARNSFEATWEFHRVKSLHGQLVDGDGSTVLYNWFTTFGVTETVVAFNFDNANLPITDKALAVHRAIEDALGGTLFTGVHAICGNDFFDAFIKHPMVKDAWDRWQDGAFLRTVNRPLGGSGGGFNMFDITWENYRGAIGGTKFVADNECRFFPTGVSNLFEVYYAPADWTETVNTTGRPLYAKQERKKWDEGIDLHMQSNPLHICTRPACLIKGEMGEGSSSAS
jgi:hypothetical protein